MLSEESTSAEPADAADAPVVPDEAPADAMADVPAADAADAEPDASGADADPLAATTLPEVTEGDMTQPADAQAEAEDLLAADALMAHAQSSPGV